MKVGIETRCLGIVLTKRMEEAKAMLKVEKEKHTTLQRRYKELLREMN